MKGIRPVTVLGMALAFAAGVACHVLYLRWTESPPEFEEAVTRDSRLAAKDRAWEPQTHRVVYAPAAAPSPVPPEAPLLQARDVEKIRSLAGHPARVRGRIFRVGHSQKSNTYFLNFGPSREALTAVIFASAVEQFEKGPLVPKRFEGREVEVHGEIKDHPQYGLEIVLENPAQIKIIN